MRHLSISPISYFSHNDACFKGADISHLSLFLGVADHDKLLPEWSHFVQFTLAAGNKDPKKSQYSDTIHGFSEKEHDWGWKKFMEISKLSDDGFVNDDTLVIEAQVQVISFSAFWLGLDQNTRHDMSRQRKDIILKELVEHFCIRKEVTSTLVMDSFCSGLEALESETKGAKLSESEDTLLPIIRMENDMFTLVDDVLLLLQKAAVEPFLPQHDQVSQKCEESNEKRYTEFGRRTIEFFVLAHIFSKKIEIAYEEAVGKDSESKKKDLGTCYSRL